MLDKHGELVLIDSLVRQYPVYSHDDIFDMEVNLVMSLVLLQKELTYLSEVTSEIARKTTK